MSGCWPWNAEMPSGQVSRHTNLIDRGELSLSRSTAAIVAVDRLKESSPRSIKFVCLLTCPEGISAFHGQHPDIPIYTAAVDLRLNEKSYIVPGLGDAGDRLFGTK